MTPKEKAEELVLKYQNYFFNFYTNYKAKKCALMVVDEILDAIVIINEHNFEGLNKYWAEVKQEIEKL
jgi:hypothetical protein